MKKILLTVACIAAAGIVFAGGGKDKTAGAQKLTKDTIQVGFVYIGTIDDEGYTQAHDKGRIALEKQGIKTRYVENVGENADCEKAIRDLIDLGCNVIYTNSFGYMDWTVKVAAEFPNVYFGHCSGYKRAPNMSTYFGKVYQARYLAGIVAGLNTTNGKIGYVAAFPIPEVIRGINAFTLGVQSVNKSATVQVMWTNTWFDPGLEKQAALELLNQGCDLIAQHQDTTAPQIAAEERGKLAIGYNVSTPGAAPKAYLTAPLFHWDVFYVSDVQKILDGAWTSRAVWEGLDTGMVSLDTITALAKKGTQEAVNEAERKIKAGSLQVFAGPIADQSGAIKIAAGTALSDDDIWNMGWFVKGVIGNVPAN